MTPNKEFHGKLHCNRAQFFLADLHVHSPASKDVVEGDRFAALSDDEQGRLQGLRSTGGGGREYEYALINQKKFPIDEYVNCLKARRDAVSESLGLSEGDDWAIVAITDHNVCQYACDVADTAWQHRKENRLIVLPGIELATSFQVTNTDRTVGAHILLIFSPNTQSHHIHSAIREASDRSWEFGQQLAVSSLPDFVNGIRQHTQYPAIAIAAHVGSQEGVRGAAVEAMREFRRAEAEYARSSAAITYSREDGKQDEMTVNRETQELQQTLMDVAQELLSEESVALDALRLIGSCGFDALRVGDDASGRHYRRLHRFTESMGRATPIICSDAHALSDIFKCANGAMPFVKMSPLSATRLPKEVFDELRHHALRFGETRFAEKPAGPVSTWIAGIEIRPDAQSASQFWPTDTTSKAFTLPLSRNLNCLIGGRGSGKSAAIEAISFATQPTYLENRGRDNALFAEDCRTRAIATLGGCNVRVCWTSLEETGDFLRKRAVFASRYFDSTEKHPDIQFSDCDEAELPPVDLPVTVFRLHEVEELVNTPTKLLSIFDSLCGKDLETLQTDIEGLLRELRGQQGKVVALARRLSQLTAEGAPLRAYIHRKGEYDAVNVEVVREKYNKLDNASAAEATASATLKKWDVTRREIDIGQSRQNVHEFFETVRQNTVGEDENVRPFHEPLHRSILEAGARGSSLRDQVIDSLTSAEAKLGDTTDALNEAAKSAGASAKAEREALAKEGLPTGGHERQAKKARFDEAETDLAEYRALVAQWDTLLGERKAVFDKLVAKCTARTEVRQSKAKAISNNLAAELDPSVLVIEVDAQPVANKDGFVAWLNNHIYPAGTRSLQARTLALVEEGLLPAGLRSILMGNGAFPTTNRSSVATGQIDRTAADKYCEHSWGMRRMRPEKQVTDVGQDVWSGLPQEIRDGLWEFPSLDSEQGTLDERRLSAILELDEIVFDDIPVIRMKDRPIEMTACRPLSELSPGQRCSAVLPILLLNGTCPLIIDQPEDNLDSRLIREVVVKILASIKLKRQVILATHNPNLPVLGDVEQAVILRAFEDKKATLEATGNLDDAQVVKLITEVMEGGREAFQHRQSIYQNYWKGPVAEGE